MSENVSWFRAEVPKFYNAQSSSILTTSMSHKVIRKKINSIKCCSSIVAEQTRVWRLCFSLSLNCESLIIIARIGFANRPYSNAFVHVFHIISRSSRESKIPALFHPINHSHYEIHESLEHAFFHRQEDKTGEQFISVFQQHKEKIQAYRTREVSKSSKKMKWRFWNFFDPNMCGTQSQKFCFTLFTPKYIYSVQHLNWNKNK